jgi:hypothetical protein
LNDACCRRFLDSRRATRNSETIAYLEKMERVRDDVRLWAPGGKASRQVKAASCRVDKRMEDVGDEVDLWRALGIVLGDGDPEAEDAALPVPAVDEAHASPATDVWAREAVNPQGTLVWQSQGRAALEGQHNHD